MAKETGQKRPLHELRQDVAHSRDHLARDIEGLRYELDFPLKFRKSFQRQTIIWVGSAIALGIIMAILPARTKKVEIEAKRRKDPRGEILGAGLALGALKFAATLLRPVVTKFVVSKIGEMASGPGRRR